MIIPTIATIFFALSVICAVVSSEFKTRQSSFCGATAVSTAFNYASMTLAILSLVLIFGLFWFR